MKLYQFIFSLVFCLFAVSSHASNRIDCQAKVALNRLYSVSVDTSTREMNIKTDNGYQMTGIGNAYFNPRTNSNTYYLSLGFNSGIQVETELSGQQRVAMCLAANECYLCR